MYLIQNRQRNEILNYWKSFADWKGGTTTSRYIYHRVWSQVHVDVARPVPDQDHNKAVLEAYTRKQQYTWTLHNNKGRPTLSS